MSKLHRLHFLRYLSENDWNDMYNSSHSFLFSIKNKYLKGIKKNPNYLKRKPLIFFETLLNNKKLLTKDINELENLLEKEVKKYYNTKNFSKDLNFFLKNVDGFMAKQMLLAYSTEEEMQTCLLHRYSLENDFLLVKKKLGKINKILESKEALFGSTNKLKKYEFYKRKAGIVKNYDVKSFPKCLDNATQNLNDFYLANIYKIACASLLSSINLKMSTKQSPLPTLPKKLKLDSISHSYKNAYKILFKIYNKKHKSIYYEEVASLLNPIENFETKKEYCISDIKSLYQIKLSICVFLIDDNPKYASAFRDTINQMTKKSILFENNTIDPRLFKRVLEIYSISNLKKEGTAFFDYYKNKLNKELIHQYLLYSKALIAFSNENYTDSVFTELNNLSSLIHNEQLYLSIKNLLLKLNYERDNFDTYSNLLESIRKFLYRHKNHLHFLVLEEHQNFLIIFKFILSKRDKNRAFKKELLSKVNKYPLPMLDRQWITKKFLSQDK